MKLPPLSGQPEFPLLPALSLGIAGVYDICRAISGLQMIHCLPKWLLCQGEEVLHRSQLSAAE